MFKIFKKSKNNVQQDDHVSKSDDERCVDHKTHLEELKCSSETIIPSEVHRHLTGIFRGLVEAYTRDIYGTDNKEALQIAYSVDKRFFEPYIQEYYKGLLMVFHPEDVKTISSILIRNEFIIYDEVLKSITRVHSKNLYEMCQKATGFDSDGCKIH